MVQICNLALAHLRSGSNIATLTDHGDPLSRICNQFYSVSRQKALRDFSWPFAKRTESLTLIDEVLDDSREWKYKYQYPNDCVRLVKIESNYRDDTRHTRERYEVRSESTGTVILTDRKEAKALFIFDEINTNRYPPEFTLALSHLVASYIAPVVTDGDTEGLGLRSKQMYMEEIGMAKINSLNEEQHEEINADEFIEFRE